MAEGELLAYLNSDDTYLPSALITVALEWMKNREIAAIVGGIYMMDQDSKIVSPNYKPYLPCQAPLDLTLVDYEKWFLPQQSGFWNASVLKNSGGFLKEELHYTMDRELYYRLCRAGRIILLDVALATYRVHENSKTISDVLKMYAEDPKALAYFRDGGFAHNFRRWLIGRWRLAQGHYRYAKAVPSRPLKLWHLFLALLNRPGYLLRRKYLQLVADSLGVLGVYHRFYPHRHARD